MFKALMNRQVQQAQAQAIEAIMRDEASAREASKQPMHARLGQWVAPDHGKRVLELGCGPGRYVGMLSRLGFDVVGLDPLSFPTWESIRKNTGAKFISGAKAEQLPFTTASFDHVACLSALLYFEDPDAAMQEIRRVLRPGGRFTLRTVNRENLYTRVTGNKLDPASKNLYTMDELRKLVEKHGFKVSETFADGFWPPMFTTAYWYLSNVWFPWGVQRLLSDALPESARVNNVLFATRD